MKLKQRPGDFRVIECLRDDAIGGPGPYRIYRVTKTKRTTFEAVERIALEAGVEKRAVEVAGLKDRQGITVQHVSVDRGTRVQLQEPGLRVEWLADSHTPIDSSWVRANGFDITVRELTSDDLQRFNASVAAVKTLGTPNYFDDQRFGALRHGQGFVAREMIDGKVESALMRCLLQPSPFDPAHEAAFKGRLRRAWGDFEQCVKLCHGAKHLSVFRHLAQNPTDFAGAFRFVSSRLRLIHLYAYQSYLWNLGVSSYLRERVAPNERILLRTDAGTVLAFASLPEPAAAELRTKTFPLLAPDVRISDPSVRRAVDASLTREGITLSQLRVPGVEGFAFKPEERAILVVPQHLHVMKPMRDEENPGFAMVRLRFELPRGSYATIVVKRLFARALSESLESETSARSIRRPDEPPRLRESGMLPKSITERGMSRPPSARPRPGGRPGMRPGGRPPSRSGGRPPEYRSGPRSDSRPGPRPDSRPSGRPPEFRSGSRPPSRPGARPGMGGGPRNWRDRPSRPYERRPFPRRPPGDAPPGAPPKAPPDKPPGPGDTPKGDA